MSYYNMNGPGNGLYSMTDPGTPGWQNAPNPNWGANPAAAGASRVGIGDGSLGYTHSEYPILVPDHPPSPQQAAAGMGVVMPQAAANGMRGLGCGSGCGCGGLGQATVTNVADSYRQTSWGVVAAAAAAALLTGVFLGWVAAKRTAKSSKSYRNNGSRGVSGSLRPNVRWSRKYKNQLPDSAFFYVEPGGQKVRTTRGTFTVPKDKRKLPYKSLSGRVDKSHLRSAISRAGQKKTQIPAAEKKRIQTRAQHMYASEFGYSTKRQRRASRRAA